MAKQLLIFLWCIRLSPLMQSTDSALVLATPLLCCREEPCIYRHASQYRCLVLSVSLFSHYVTIAGQKNIQVSQYIASDLFVASQQDDHPSALSWYSDLQCYSVVVSALCFRCDYTIPYSSKKILEKKLRKEKPCNCKTFHYVILLC